MVNSVQHLGNKNENKINGMRQDMQEKKEGTIHTNEQ